MIVKFFNRFWRMEIMTFQVKIVSLFSCASLISDLAMVDVD